MTDQNVHLLTGAYALDAVDDVERAAIERELATSPEAAAEAGELAEAAARLGASHATTPPSGLRDAVLAAARTTPQVGSHATKVEEVAAKAERQRFNRGLGAVAAAIVLVIAAAGLTWAVEEQRARDDRSLINAQQERIDRIEAVLTAPDAIVRSTSVEGSVRISAVFSAQQGAAVVSYASLPDIPEKRTYELWRIRNTKNKSMEILAPDARAGTDLLLGLSEGDLLAFTEEPEGGSGQPTGKPIVTLFLK